MNRKELAIRVVGSLTFLASIGLVPGCNNEGAGNYKIIKLEDIPPALRPAPMPEPKGQIRNGTYVPIIPVVEPEIPQIGGRVSGDVNELSKYRLVIDQCSSFPGSCVGRLEKNGTEQEK